MNIYKIVGCETNLKNIDFTDIKSPNLEKRGD